ncbi:hypothetical protein [Flammeovirga agarivorans]|uniref:Uncharacterized protein n=1 Tax=Flammeovirga agarivorans TaxID=2726742 RepID=A0A7X8SGG9_9BACT|nr:hypothetical protein [Flammeovirga agarivorans]NLR89744.1 hypothetical protein [Flammeovirga agarivorans]
MKKLLFATIIGMFMMSCNDSEVNPIVDDNVDPGYENPSDPGFDNPGVDPDYDNPGNVTLPISE